MANTSTINVNKLLKHTDILQSLGIKYTVNKNYAKCPCCKKPQLARFRLSNSGDDTTYYCYSCMYAGDLFDLYRVVNYIDTVDKVFTDLIAKNFLIIGSDALTSKDIKEYNVNSVTVTTNIDEYWFTSKQNLYRGNITIGKQILQSYGLWPGTITDTSYYKSAFRFIGISGLEHVNKMLEGYGVSDGIKKGWQGFIVYPYEIVPGVIRNFVIQNEKHLKKLDYEDKLVPFNLSDKGDGFFMLSSVKPTDHTVYAFSEPAMALQAQHSHYSRGASEPAPIVAWGEDTDIENWYNLPGKKVVLYSPEFNHEVFLNAILCGFRAHISIEPKVTSARAYHEEYRNKGTVFHKKIEEQAVPWPEAMVRWLMDATIDNGIDIINRLPIGFHEKGMILDACAEQSQKDRISKIFGSDKVNNRFVEIGNSRIHEENSEWYSVGLTNNVRERVCSHPIYFEEILIDTDKKLPPMVNGFIRHNTSTFKFSTDLAKFEKNPLTAYKDLVVTVVKAMPFIAPSIQKNLLATIYAFQSPVSVLRPSNIGYSTDTKEFRLANIVISGTGCKSIECPLENPPTAGLGVYPADLPKDVAYSMVSPGHRSEVFLAVFASFMRNVICYATSASHKPIGIIGEPWKNPVGWRAVIDISEAFRVPIHTLTSKPVSTLKTIIQNYDYKLPLILDISGCNSTESKEVLSIIKDKNVIVPLTVMQATTLGITGDWMIIDARAISSSDKRSPLTWCAISFLEHYLRVGAPDFIQNESSANSPTVVVLNAMKSWLLPAAIDAEAFNKLFTKAAVIARGNRLLREDKVKALLLDIYTISMTLKKVSATKWVESFMVVGEVECGSNIVLVDTKADVVLIHVKNFIEACSTHGGAVINPSDITEILNSSNALVTDKIEKGVYSIPGWAIKGDVWNNAVDAFTTDVAIKLFS